MDKRFLVGGGALLVALSALGYAWLGSRGPEPLADKPAAVAASGSLTAAAVSRLGIRLEPAASLDSVPLGTVPGQVSLPPKARVAVTAPFPGVAARVLVLEGEQVAQGQPLAVLRSAEPLQFGAELARAQADLGVDRAKAERLSLLAREGVVAGARADEAHAALARTEATISENRRLLALAGSASDGTVTLRSPIAGRVAQVGVEVGGPVGGGNAPFVIENTAELTLDLQLPERMAGRVAPGMTVTVPLRDGGQVAGRIVSVGASIDPVSRSIPAKATLSAAQGLVPGQGISAIIADASNPARGGVSVPATAVTRIGDQSYVFVRQGQGSAARFVRRRVSTLIEAGGRAVLSGDLKPGEPVVVSGVAELKSVLGGE